MKFELAGFSKVFLICLFLVFTGCSSQKINQIDRSESSSSSEDRMVMKNAEVTIEVKNPNEVYAALSEILENQKGYLVTSRLTSEDRYYALVKVPSAALETSLSLISNLGKETNKKIFANDITDEFKDQTAELENLISLRERLKALLDKAITVKEVLEVENQLNRVQTNIDQITGRLNYLTSRVSYSTIEVTAQKQKIYGPIGYLGVGMWWLVEKLFVIQ